MADIYDGKNKTERDRDDPELNFTWTNTISQSGVSGSHPKIREKEFDFFYCIRTEGALDSTWSVR